jgi:hypothetical protein
MVSRSIAITLGLVCIVLIALMAYFTVNLQNQVNNLTEIVNLEKSTVWVDGGTVDITPLPSYEGKGPPAYEEKASFAGYVSVQVSSQYNVVVEVSYLCQGVSYYNSIIVSKSGTTTFPVLPPSNISFNIYLTQSVPFVLNGPLYANVTITYYY